MGAENNNSADFSGGAQHNVSPDPGIPPATLEKLKDLGANCVEVDVPLPIKPIARLLGLKYPMRISAAGEERGKCSGADSAARYVLNEEELHWVLSRKLPRVLSLFIAEYRRVLIYTLVGASGIVVNLYAALLFLYNVAARLIPQEALGYFASSSFGFEASVLWNFVLHEKLTFRGTRQERGLGGILKRLAKYHVASAASYLAQVMCATFLPIALGLAFYIAQLIGILIGFTLNLILGYFYTWSRHRA